MTRTDVMASSRPRNASAATSRGGSSRISRRLCALPVALLLALTVLLPSTAVAAQPGTAGYAQETNKPATTTPKTGTLPSKEAAKPTPTSEAEPAKTSTTPTASPKATTLPFTGFDLRWDIGFGVVLLGAGFSILAMQRRQRRGSMR
jgi:cell division septation protein DedD